MPNGRSGGFVIETADLKQLLEAVTGDAVVGRLITGLKPFQSARVAEMMQAIEKCPHSRLAVEEQDHALYVIHISNQPDIVWVVISSESPLFMELRRRHAEWIAERPGWNGWMTF